MSRPPIDPFSGLDFRSDKQLPSGRVLDALKLEIAESISAPVPIIERVGANSRGRRAVLSLLVLALALIVSAAHALKDSAAILIMSAFIVGVSAAALLFVGGVPGTMRAISPSLRRGIVYLSPFVVAIGLGVFADYFASFTEFFADQVTGKSALQLALSCLIHAFLCAALGTVLLLRIWKQSDPFAPGVTGALFGILGGIAGVLSVHFRCDSHEGLHLTLGHGLVIFLSALLGHFVGRKWLTP